MLALFCLRLAVGLSASMLLLFRAPATPSFYRTLFLVILGLLTGFLFFRWTSNAFILLGMVFAFAGSVVWMLQGARGGQAIIVCSALTLAAGLFACGEPASPTWHYGLALYLDDFSSAAFLGGATAAMLLGHSYLVEPNMSIAPLMRMLLGLFAGVLVRIGYTALEMSQWVPRVPWSDTLAFSVAVRWGVGFAGPLLLGWMAWRCARIRSTQSATGILYVVVVLSFMGELMNHVVQEMVREAKVGHVQY